MIDCRKSAPSFPRGLAATCCGVALALACAGSLPQQALALTAAEKQAEADAKSAKDKEIADLKAKIGDQTGKEAGCGGSIAIAGSSIGAMAVLGAALVFKKKREDK